MKNVSNLAHLSSVAAWRKMQQFLTLKLIHVLTRFHLSSCRPSAFDEIFLHPKLPLN
jgi:hypothetical protein